MEPILEARQVGMTFPGVRALSAVDFDLRPAEVHALVGENGAGKSTLVKILNGELTQYEGTIAVGGRVRHFGSPRDARAAGIAVIPQELQLVRSLSVAENICLGHEQATAGLVDRAAVRAMARRQLEAVGRPDIPLDAPLASLEAGDRQMVAIARVLSLEARCLIMDEPTAALGEAECARLEGVIRRLVAGGVSVLYVSHKLGEVSRLADRITVLRDGVRVDTMNGAGVSEADLIRLMVGREITPVTLAPVLIDGRELLAVESLCVADPSRPDGFGLKDISLTVRAGEIIGLAGLVGARRTEFLLALVGGLDRTVSGRIRLDGRDYVPASPAEAREAGLVLLPEERKAAGIFPRLGVAHNVTISALDQVSRLGWIDRAREAAAARQLMERIGVRAAKPSQPIASLSGGNQQKALLARCLFASPRVLLLDEPTRGIDLAARAEIYAELRRLAAEGFGIVLCSSEMAEILSLCHRIVVFREGRVTATMDRAEASEERILAAATGTGPPAVRSGSHGSASAPPPAPGPWRRLARYAGFFGLAAVLLLAIVSSPTRGGRLVFLDPGNLADILRQVSEKGILAVGMTAVVIAGGIDLSVGSVLAFAATLAAWLFMRAGIGLPGATLIVVAAGALWGFLNGMVVARWSLAPFIATLATMSAARGAARYLSGGTAIPLGFGPGGAPESVRTIAGPLIPYVPIPALFFVGSVVAMQILLARTRTGRYLYAVGDNEPAARLAGIRVGAQKVTVYVISAALAALAGLVHCAQLEQGNPNDGVAYELDAIAAVVIGGTSLSGGTGSVGGTLIGVLTIGIINNSMGLNNVDANLQLILKGAIILAAVWLQRRRA